MATTLANLNTSIDDKRRSTGSGTISSTGNGFRAINSTLQLWNMQHEWPWQKEFTNFNYNEGITWYTVPSNFKAVLDVRPVRPPQTDEFYMVTGNAFDSAELLAFRFGITEVTQTRYLRMKYAGNKTTINNATDTGTGTWTASGGVSNLADDSYEFFDLTASVSFDYTGTTGTVSTTLASAIDVSRYAQRSSFYVNVFLQSVTGLTGVVLKVGNSASNYLTTTVTTDYLGNALAVGWNRVKLTWDGSTTVVGTLTNSTFQYTALTITYSGSVTTYNNRMENWFVTENIPIRLDYYSSAMVIDISASNAKLQIFNDSAATSDTPMWTGEWDWVTEEFVNSVMEIIFNLTGEADDQADANVKIKEQVDNLKRKIPSSRRYPQISMTVDLNETRGGRPSYWNKYKNY